MEDDKKTNNCDHYLTLVPRGLEIFVTEIIKTTLLSHSYSCIDLGELGSSPIAKLSAQNNLVENIETTSKHDFNTDFLHDKEFKILNDIAARIEQNKIKKNLRKRKKKEATPFQKVLARQGHRDGSGQDGRPTTHGNTNTKNLEAKEKNNVPMGSLFENDLSHVAGSVHIPAIGTDISLGYHCQAAEGPNETSTTKIISVPGTIEGVALLSFRTNAPPPFVASMKGMGCGPLLALIKSSANVANCDDSAGEILSCEHTLENSLSAIQQFLNGCENSVVEGRSHDVSYFEQFQSALRLWHRHVCEVWLTHNSIYDISPLSVVKPPQQPFAYRLSCMRSQSKKYKYKREALLPRLAEWLIPWDDLHRLDLNHCDSNVNHLNTHYSCKKQSTKIISSNMEEIVNENTKQQNRTSVISGSTARIATSPDNLSQSAVANRIDSYNGEREENSTNLGKDKNKQQWYVDLRKYDFEILALLHSNCVTIAIPLRPYQHLGAKSYSSNSIPPDVSALHMKPGSEMSRARERGNANAHCKSMNSDNERFEIGSKSSKLNIPLSIPRDFVRLRPSTADILLHIAKPPPHSIVIDPCAGVGTIPLRASIHSHFGLGGELSPNLFWAVAPTYFRNQAKYVQNKHDLSQVNSKNSKIADMIGWDVTLLPLRDSFADVIVSDIPFGQKCLSTKELSAFLPIFVYQCARVLVPGSGKMVLLCGNFEWVLMSLMGLNKRSILGGSEFCNADNTGSSGVHDVLSNRVIDSGNGNEGVNADKAVFELPCESIFPVNVGGFIAWVLVVRRGRWSRPVPPKNYRSTAKKTLLNRIKAENSKAASQCAEF